MATEAPDRHSLRVLTVNTADGGGGAEAIAVSLALSFRAMGVRSYLAVGRRQQKLDGSFVLADYDHQHFLKRCVNKPVRWLRAELGHEAFDFPSSWRLLSVPPERPDIVHIHNMHGGYFDLRALAWLSHQVPTVVTLHDAWMLSGHCAHSFACERWRTGCGSCPDLTIPPRIKRDGTRYNWKRKQRVYRHSRLYVAAPSAWLMSKAEDSILRPGIVESRVIPNGVDTTVFRPADRASARSELGIPAQARVVLFTANGIRRNPWKDYPAIRAAVAALSARMSDLILIGLGEDASAETAGSATVRFVPYQRDKSVVARYYQAADLYVHAAHAENFPTTILEALACGTPVIATAVGGIPEQIRSLMMTGSEFSGCDRQDATGVLVPAGDSQRIAAAVERLLTDGALLRELAANAARDAKARFDRLQQADAYLSWYSEIRAGRTEPPLHQVTAPALRAS